MGAFQLVFNFLQFIETYVDPYGARAEWEGRSMLDVHHTTRGSSFPTGFTAVVNKELSAKYEILVDRAPELIQVLPWGKDFEVDVFRKPDFTALEVLSFATGGEFYFLNLVKMLNSMEVFLLG